MNLAPKGSWSLGILMEASVSTEATVLAVGCSSLGVSDSDGLVFGQTVEEDEDSDNTSVCFIYVSGCEMGFCCWWIGDLSAVCIEGFLHVSWGLRYVLATGYGGSTELVFAGILLTSGGGPTRSCLIPSNSPTVAASFNLCFFVFCLASKKHCGRGMREQLRKK